MPRPVPLMLAVAMLVGGCGKPTDPVDADRERVAAIAEEARRVAAELASLHPDKGPELEVVDAVYQKAKEEIPRTVDGRILEGLIDRKNRSEEINMRMRMLNEQIFKKKQEILAPAVAAEKANEPRLQELYRQKKELQTEWQSIYDRHPEWPAKPLFPK